MFISSYEAKMNKNGSLRLPGPILEKCACDSLYITKGISECLYAFPPEQWEEVLKWLYEKGDSPDRDEREFARYIFGSVSIVDINKSKITIPQLLIIYAGLAEQVIIIGNYNRIEIWDKERYNNLSI